MWVVTFIRPVHKIGTYDVIDKRFLPTETNLFI